MTTIAAPRGRLLPFDEEEWLEARAKSRTRARSRIAWVLLPVLALLAAAGMAYTSQVAQGTALAYRTASLEAQRSQLEQTAQLLQEELEQAQSAGAVNAAATRLGLGSPSRWQVVTPPSGPDPLLPVLLALKGA